MNTPILPGTPLPQLGGSLGAYIAYPDGSTHALIVADKAHTFVTPWGPARSVKGATGIDGMASTQAMAKAGSKAAQRVLALRIDGHADFYIPSRLELFAVQQMARELLPEKGWGWTSTQDGASSAWVCGFTYGYQHDFHKSYEGSAVAVRRLTLESFNALLCEGGAA